MSIAVSIIIVSYNTSDYTLKCIESIRAAKISYAYEIIVVDNASKDDTVEMIKQNYPDTVLIENKKNHFFAVANNQGAGIAKGKYLLLLNSDTVVIPNQMEKLVYFLEGASENIVCVGPRILHSDMSLQSEGYALPSVWERAVLAFKLHKLLPARISKKIVPVGTPGLYACDHEVGWISGSCMLIRRDMYMQMGGLNEELEFYGEEPEFGWRLRVLGYKTYLVYDATVIHHGGKSTTTKVRRSDRSVNLRRYSKLQYYTVGYLKSIAMSTVVWLSILAKLTVVYDSKKRSNMRRSLKHEQGVVRYMWVKYRTSEKNSALYY
jgi:GT2 family glycosyltransferase